jgi:hypothetical protein
MAQFLGRGLRHQAPRNAGLEGLISFAVLLRRTYALLLQGFSR